MNKERYISHGQDLTDAISEIKNIRYPYMLVATRMPPEKIHENEYETKRRLQAYYYRSVVTTYARAAGIDEMQVDMSCNQNSCAQQKSSQMNQESLMWCG